MSVGSVGGLGATWPVEGQCAGCGHGIHEGGQCFGGTDSSAGQCYCAFGTVEPPTPHPADTVQAPYFTITPQEPPPPPVWNLSFPAVPLLGTRDARYRLLAGVVQVVLQLVLIGLLIWRA